ncbi:hypothetical protein L4X63_09695 [Geomonas sp. Red32]|uniref:hypothetical protein n=1 Tax=Geomonas sp. Red32 TaxID=2912856 RepID=UPI00202CC3DB|nr:hypothetical protein [Geomonas sp. Red32]MCM0081862.1 hypothetical protein [Geomonas sp. Red32]
MAKRNPYDFGYFGALNNALRERAAEKFHDPIVTKAYWLPINLPNALFLRESVQTAGKLEYRVCNKAKLGYLFFILAGIGSAFTITGTRIATGELHQFKTYTQLLFSIVIAVVGVVMARHAKDIVFDVGQGIFRKGASLLDEDGSMQNMNSCYISDIHAIQLIPVHNSGSPGSYATYTYAMNLVLTSGKRIPVFNHSFRDRLLDDAHDIGTLIQRPVWDLIDESMDVYKVRAFKCGSILS